MIRSKRSIGFAAIDCLRCGEQRVLARPCSACGLRPPAGETNPRVVARRQRVREVDAELEEPSAPAIELPNDVGDELIRLVKAFLAHVMALTAEGSGITATDALAKDLRRLRALESGLATTSSLRPNAEARGFFAAAGEWLRLWPIYREALTTGDPARAQELASEAQTILDGGTAELQDIRAAVSAAEQMADATGGLPFWRRAMNAVSQRHPGLDFETLMEHGRELAARTLDTAVGPTSGYDYLVLELVAQAHLDPAAMRAKLQAASSLVAQQPERLREIAEMTRALDDLPAMRRDVFEALTDFQLTLANSKSDAGAVRRLAKLAGDLYEHAVPLFAWYSLLTTPSAGEPDRYVRVCAKDSTALARALASSNATLFDDAPPGLRNAAHHGKALQVDERERTVSIELRRHHEVLTFEAYLDRVFAFIETLLAANWVLWNALEVAGLDIPVPPAIARDLGLNPEDLLLAWLEEAKGVRVARFDHAGAHWVLEAGIPENEVLPFAQTFAHLASAPPASITVATSEDAADPLVLLLSEYDERTQVVRDAEGLDLVAAMLELRHAFTIDSACILRRDEIEASIWTIGINALRSKENQIPRLRRLRTLAERHGHSDLGDLAVRFMRSGRDPEIQARLRLEASKRPSLTPPRVPQGSRVTLLLDPTLRPRRPCDQ